MAGVNLNDAGVWGGALACVLKGRRCYRFFGQHVTVNDCLPNRILSGTVKVKGGIEQLTERPIVFEADSKETPIDDVVLATGYNIRFPFLGEEVRRRRRSTTTRSRECLSFKLHVYIFCILTLCTAFWSFLRLTQLYFVRHIVFIYIFIYFLV